MTNNIFVSVNELMSDILRDLKDDDSPVPNFLFSFVLLLLLLLRKHISIAPNVTKERNTINNIVALPSCMI
jgi:hypothetical protein